MSHDDELTPAPPRRQSSIKIEQWGIAAHWLAASPTSRRFTLTVVGSSLVVTAWDGETSAAQVVDDGDDPSRAAVRALSRVSPGG